MPPDAIAGRADVCFACGLIHCAPNPCTYDCTAPCFDCGKPRGLRRLGNDRKPATNARTCWTCWTCWATEVGLIGPRPAEVAHAP